MHISNIITRINRILARDEEVLRQASTPKQKAIFGEFFTVDLRFNCISATHLDINQMAKQMGVA